VFWAWPLGPKPQSQFPNPQSPIPIYIFILLSYNIIFKNKIILKYLNKNNIKNGN
jgi:hypothetical protein